MVKMNKKYRKYLQNAVVDMLEHDVEIKFLKHFKHAGEWLDIEKVFVCKIDNDIEGWFQVFIHEYCHFQQWKDKKYSGGKWAKWDTELQLWLDGKLYLSKKKGKYFAARMRTVELDCEKRAVKEIKKYKLDIDISYYIQQANAYIYSYNILGEMGYWYKGMPCEVPEIIDLMPSKFVKRYDRMPKGYRELVLEHLYD